MPRDGTHNPAPAVVPYRAVITVCAMAATLMQALDSTIANVALPYMQGSLSASSDQITWVLTSYITAAAIMTAPVGWIAGRFGLKQLFVVSVVGFTITSMLCGIAETLPEMVVFRSCKACSAPRWCRCRRPRCWTSIRPEQRGSAMALWGMGVMVGPILGPTLGGYLTELYDWRWVFFVNLPFGAAATLGLVLCLPRSKPRRAQFDWFGFTAFAIGIAGLQLMLDRGETQDWFSSTEIITEAVMAGLGLYLFIVHLFTADRPFINPRIFRDRNLSAGLLMMFAVGMVLLAVSALLAPWLQTLGDYPVETAGLTMAPRGIGTMLAMLIAGRLSSRVDARLLMAFGILALSWSLYRMTGWTPDVSQQTLIVNTMLQGFGLGFVFIPLQVIAFATLDPALRTDGTSLISLMRNVGSAIGISVTTSLLTTNTQIEHASLAATITPMNRALQTSPELSHMLSPATPLGAQTLNHMITRQAQIIAYNNDWKLMMLVALPMLLLLLFMRRPPKAAAGPTVPLE